MSNTKQSIDLTEPSQRQILAEAVSLLLNDVGYHVIVSPNEFDPMNQMPHSGLLIQMPNAIRGLELSTTANAVITQAKKLGIFSDEVVKYSIPPITGRVTVHSEQIILPLSMNIEQALAQVLGLAEEKAWASEDKIQKHEKSASSEHISLEEVDRLMKAAHVPLTHTVTRTAPSFMTPTGEALKRGG